MTREQVLVVVNKALPCWCIPAYTDRGLTQPDCPRCNFAEDVTDSLLARLAQRDTEREQEIARIDAAWAECQTRELEALRDNNSLRAALRSREQEVERLRDDLDRWVHAVEMPRKAHLHYDGCPYKPFADVPDHDLPDAPPECTCAERHKGAYWKGQLVLERTRRRLDVRSLRATVEQQQADLDAWRTDARRGTVKAKMRVVRVIPAEWPYRSMVKPFRIESAGRQSKPGDTERDAQAIVDVLYDCLPAATLGRLAPILLNRLHPPQDQRKPRRAP